ncbi:MAG TPA: RDD family protein [Urbifossiella sp.]|nr:RDD family protein [Urbifossiella sp.]
MRWTDELRIETPEQIGVELELAGLGSRFVAQVVDWLWKGFVTLLLVLAAALVLSAVGREQMLADPSKAMAALLIAGLYGLWLGYGIYFETRWNGQTPGKRFARIRAVRQNGTAIDVPTAFIRNLLAIADFLPAFDLLGAVLIMLTNKRQRLGDLAAGTIVVRERVADLPEEADELLDFASDDFTFSLPQLALITPADRILIRSFLQRFHQMKGSGRERLALKMVDSFISKMDYDAKVEIYDVHVAREFLASLLRDYELVRRHQ